MLQNFDIKKWGVSKQNDYMFSFNMIQRVLNLFEEIP